MDNDGRHAGAVKEEVRTRADNSQIKNDDTTKEKTFMVILRWDLVTVECRGRKEEAQSSFVDSEQAGER
jgi:hypothetical protein